MSGFRVLGPVEAWTADGRLLLGGPRHVALLAYLLLNANRAVSADAVIDAVWGAERDGAAKRLQMAISRLRRALEPMDLDDGPRLRTVSGGYLLSVGPDEVDAEVFAQWVRDGREALEHGDPGRASNLLTEALALWRGRPLAEVAFEDFAQPEIRRLEELRLGALETRIEADLQRGRHAEVVAELEGLLAQQPSRERFAAQLMTALYRAGRQADALEVYQRTRTHLAEQLGLEPGPALKALQTQILGQAAALEQKFGSGVPAPAVLARRGMPWPATPTVGRERELEDIRALLLSPGVRLVTVTGPGGVGKTRLALAVARAVEQEFADGVRLAELAGVGRPEDVGSTLVRALGATPAHGESAAETLSRCLADKDLLFVVDNFEHVLAAARLVGELIANCPGLTVLATSREVLNLAPEHQYRVAPMPLPARPSRATVAEVEAADGTALFLAAARRHEQGFAITAATAPVVAEVCSRLDGLPLALELAAARIGVLTLLELAAGLDGVFTGLGSGPRDAPERQQTLQATITWSYRLLRDDQQQAFLRFAVFAGGATAAAAQEVTGATREALEALQAKSLLRRHEQPDGTTRLTMLETLRQFALDHDVDRANLEDARCRHFSCYSRLVEDLVPRLSTPDEARALDALDRDIDNIRSALDWALAADPGRALTLAGFLGDYWYVRHDLEGLAWLEAALIAAGDKAPAEDRARLLLKRAFQFSVRGQQEAAVDAATLALDLYRESSDDAGMANAYCALSVHREILGHVTEARSSAEAACCHARATGDDALQGRSLSRLATVLPHSERLTMVERAAPLLSQAGDYRELAQLYLNVAYRALLEDRPEEAIDLLNLALPAAERLRAPVSRIWVLGNVGLANLLAGNRKQAGDAFVEQLKLCTDEAFRIPADEGLVGLAAVFVLEGRLEQAAQLLGAAKAMGYPGPSPADQAMLDRLDHDYFDAARARLTPAVWTQLTRAGAEFSFDQAIAFALAEAAHLDQAAGAAAENVAGV